MDEVVVFFCNPFDKIPGEERFKNCIKIVIGSLKLPIKFVKEQLHLFQLSSAEDIMYGVCIDWTGFNHKEYNKIEFLYKMYQNLEEALRIFLKEKYKCEI